MEHTLSLEIDNIMVRPMQSTDLEQIRKWRNDPNNSIFLRKIPFISSEQQISWFESCKKDTDNYLFAIDETRALNRLVGSFSLYNIEKDRLEFGKILVGDPEAHGKHVGENALKAAIEITFNCLKKNELVLHVFADNIPAVKAYSNAGMRVISSRIVDGKNEYLMSILKK